MALTFTWGTTKISISLIIYLLISVSLGLYLVKYMYTLNKVISAMIVFILLILIFVFFGRRWFQYGQLKGTKDWTLANAAALSDQITTVANNDACRETETQPAGLWPPVVNYCPDFMTIDSSGNCVDTVNKLYGSGTSIGTSMITKYAGTSNVCPSVAATPTNPANLYLRWEGVVQAEGSCNPGNIGKAPMN